MTDYFYFFSSIEYMTEKNEKCLLVKKFFPEGRGFFYSDISLDRETERIE